MARDFSNLSDLTLTKWVKYHEGMAEDFRAELTRRQIDALPPIAFGDIIECRHGQISRMDLKVTRVDRFTDGRLSSVWGHRILESGGLSKRAHWILAQEIYGRK